VSKQAQTLPHGRMAPGWYLSNFGGMVVYGAMVASPRVRRALARGPIARIPASVLTLGFAAAAATHVVETVHALRVARADELPARSIARVGVRTLAVGFPSVLALREARQVAARRR
jgi:hypothetical protein